MDSIAPSAHWVDKPIKKSILTRPMMGPPSAFTLYFLMRPSVGRLVGWLGGQLIGMQCFCQNQSKMDVYGF